MRFLLMLLLGLIVGAICGTIAARNIALSHAYSRGVMAVLQQHAGDARRELALADRCAPEKVRAHFAAIAAFSAEIGPALRTEDDARAQSLFENMSLRAAQAAHAADTMTCEKMAAELESVNKACNECHREYR